jgi:predicted dehydrogenase
MLTISAGHQLDAFTTVLGEFTRLGSAVATRRSRVRDRETGEVLPMTAPDQVAVAGQLEGGAVAAVHVRGGSSRATNFLWEINGTEGDLVVSTSTGLAQFGTIQGGRGDETEVRELAVPASYHEVPALAGQEQEVSYAVAHAYAHLRRDLTEGTSLVPDFDAAVVRHRLLDQIERAAARP